jgi:hypothetical protein
VLKVRARGLAVAVALIAAGLAPAAARAASIDLGDVGFGTVVVDDARQHAFVSAPIANAIYEFDVSGHLVATIPNVYGAWGMTISGNYLYVAENTAGAIVRLDLTSSAQTPQTVATGLSGPEWLVMTGGLLWTTKDVNSNQSDNVVSVDPSTGTLGQLPGTFSAPDLAVSPGDPSTLFVSEDGLSPGTISRYDVSVSPAVRTAYNSATDQENIEGMVVSADGTRLIPASGAPYMFEELSASTLQPDGPRYPGQPYPSAVAVSASGVLATGLDNGYSSPDVGVYNLGAPAATWTASTNNSDGTANVAPHGLALSSDGATLFVVTHHWTGQAPPPASTDIAVHTLQVGGPSSSPPTTTTTSSSPPPSTTTTTPATPKPTAPAPPQLVITPKSKPGKPDVYVQLGAFREVLIRRATRQIVGYRYYFSAQNIRCINGATNLLVTIGRRRHVLPCRSGLLLIGTQVAPHRTYTIHVEAVRMRRRRIVKRGPTYPWRAYMPGNEATWTPVSTPPPVF